MKYEEVTQAGIGRTYQPSLHFIEERNTGFPETSIVFTVKLPPSLIERIRSFARFKEMSISTVVRTALEDFLSKKDHGQRTEAS